MPQYDPAGLKDRLNRHHRPKGGAGGPVPYYSGAFESSVAGLNQNLANTQASLAGQGLQLEQQYGFGSDQSNPYSQARQLERSRQAARLGTTNNYAASGQLYAGSLSNAQAENEYQAGASLDAAQREYLRQRAGLAQEGTEAQQDYSQGLLEAEADRLQAAIEDRPSALESPRKRHLKEKVKRHH